MEKGSETVTDLSFARGEDSDCCDGGGGLI